MRRVIYSMTTSLESVEGNTRLARDGVAEELIETRTSGARVVYVRCRRAL